MGAINTPRSNLKSQRIIGPGGGRGPRKIELELELEEDEKEEVSGTIQIIITIGIKDNSEEMSLKIVKLPTSK